MGIIIMNGVEYSSSPKDGFPPIIYSDEEREIGVWRDGKPLYEKTISLGSSIYYDTNWHEIAHGISNIDKVVKMFGFLYDNSSNEFVEIPNFRANTSAGITLKCDTTNIVYMNNWFGTSNLAFVTIQYTKTTDRAGSGKYTTYGGLTHHYSTTEQVVGSWIDGKPVYERVIQITTTSGNYNMNVSSFNIDIITNFNIFIKNTNGDDYAFDSYWQASDDRLGWYLESDKSVLVFRSGRNYAYGAGYAIIQYTKTTD